MFTEGEDWDESLLVMAGDLLLQAMQFAATVHLEPRNRGQFTSANPNILVEDLQAECPVMMEMAGVVVFAEEPEDNRLVVEDLHVECPVTMLAMKCPVTDSGWKAVDSSWKVQPPGGPLQAPTVRQRIVVVAVWQDRVVVLQRGDVVIMPGATIEDGASMIKEAVRVLWETAGILVDVRSCTWVPRPDLAELVVGVRLNSGGELSAEDNDWEPVWCDRDELGVPVIREIIDKVAGEAPEEEVVLVCLGSEGEEQNTDGGIEGFDE